MLHNFKGRLRLRPLSLFQPRFSSNLAGLHTLHLRLADKHHRSHFRNLESEARKFKKEQNQKCITLRPNSQNLLVWAHIKKHKVDLKAQLGNPVLPSPMKVQAISEIAMFHFLSGLYLEADCDWLSKLEQHLDALLVRISKNKKFQVQAKPDLDYICQRLDIPVQSGSLQHNVLTKSLSCLSFEPSASELNVLAWVHSLTSSNVTEACRNLTNLSDIPAFVTSDILLRTPVSREELHLQLDVWKTFMGSIGAAYHEKTTHLTSIIHNLAYYSVHYDTQTISDLISLTLNHFTSTTSGYVYKLITTEFVNDLVFSLAYFYIQSSVHNHSAAMAIIKAQELLVHHIGHSKLTQNGYVGVILAIAQVSDGKAQRLFEICQQHHHELSTFSHMASIYLSSSPEQLLHTFNNGVAQYPKSTALWLVFIKKLQSLELLTEQRCLKMLGEMVDRKQELIISKAVVLTLLQQIESINGIEKLIEILEREQLFELFKNTIMSKYLTLLYRASKDKNVRKPYLDRIVRNSSNLECARFLYLKIERKTPAMVGAMLLGESQFQPQKIYNMYIAELRGKSADEHCILALLRACLKQPDGEIMVWGKLLAPQVAVHEFKNNVAKRSPPTTASESGIIPSNKLWRAYIHALLKSDYLTELAEVMRWWEQLQFVPSKSTLWKLLRALPKEFAERHIKHANAVPGNANVVLEWPWPTLEEFREIQ